MLEKQKVLQKEERDLSAITQLAGKYITFKLANEVYAFGIQKVREIIGMMEITRAPQFPQAIRGVINLRGKIVPVLELRKVFGMTERVPTDTTVIAIVQIHTENKKFSMGVLVDEVLEVLSVDASDIEPPPNIGASVSSEQGHILGVAKKDNRVIFLLEVDRIMSAMPDFSVSA